MLCAKYNLQSERTFETPCISASFNLITDTCTDLLTHTGEDKEIVERDMSLHHAPSLALSATEPKI